MKRLFAMLLPAALCAAILCLPAFAAEPETPAGVRHRAGVGQCHMAGRGAVPAQ